MDSAVARRLIFHVGGKVGIPREAGGKSKLDPLVPKFLSAARHQQMKWLILRDLDRDGKCAPELRKELLGANDPRLCFRIAVREVESWLMADPSSIAQFLRVSPSKIPEWPDQIDDPKEKLIALARGSTKVSVKAALVPHPKSGLPTGPEYTSWMAEFASRHWDLPGAVASSRSPSLVKAVQRISELVAL